VEDEIGHSMADMQSPGVELANSPSPVTNVNVGGGDVQSKDQLEWLQVFERSTVGVGGRFLSLGRGFDGDGPVPLLNNHIAESDGPSFANNPQELIIDLNAFDDALCYNNTASFQDTMEGFDFPEFLNALAFEIPSAASEISRTTVSNEWLSKFEHDDPNTPPPEISMPHNLDSAYSSHALQSASSSTDDQKNSQSSSPSSSTMNEHNPPILRPFACDVHGCTRSYKRVHELRRHKKTHSGVKPYVCGYLRCVRSGHNGFTRKDHLMQHLRQVHGQRR